MFPMLQTIETIDIDANETIDTNIHDIDQTVLPLLPLTDPNDVDASYSPSRAQTRPRYLTA